MLGDVRGILGCILCQKRLRLSGKVDECKPLPSMMFRFEKHVDASLAPSAAASA